MKKIRLVGLATILAFSASSFSLNAMADTQSGVKRANYTDKYDRKCVPEKYTPKNATCNKEKMNSKYFLGAVARIESEVKGRGSWETVADEIKELVGLGEKPSAVIIALSNLGYNKDQIESILKDANIDLTKVVVNKVVDKFNDKKDDKKGGHHHHDVATNGGHSHDRDGQTVSCVKA